MNTLSSLCRTILLGAVAAFGPNAPVLAQSDADFLAAKMAYDKGDRAKLAVIAPKLTGHVLAPYVSYWQLKLGLDDAAPVAISAYLDRYPNTPIADRLRVDWLKSLARRNIWNRFALDYAQPPGEDVELACYGILLRWQREGDPALAAAVPLWFTGQTTPDACDPLFAALIKRGDITMADRRARFRLANEAGNVRRVRIRQKDHVIAEFPLTFGVVGALLAPMLAAVGAVAGTTLQQRIDSRWLSFSFAGLLVVVGVLLLAI